MKKKLVVIFSCLVALVIAGVAIISSRRDNNNTNVVYARTYRDASSFGFWLSPNCSNTFCLDKNGLIKYLQENNDFIIASGGSFTNGVYKQSAYRKSYTFEGCACGISFKVDCLADKYADKNMKKIAEIMSKYKGVYNYPVFIWFDNLDGLATERADLPALIVDTFTRWYNFLTAKENGKLYPVFISTDSLVPAFLHGEELKDMDICICPNVYLESFLSEKCTWNIDLEVLDEYPGIYNGVARCGWPDIVYEFFNGRKAGVELIASFKDYPSIIVNGGYNGFEKPVEKCDVSIEENDGVRFSGEMETSIEEGQTFEIDYSLNYCYELKSVLVKPKNNDMQSNAVVTVSDNKIKIENIDCDYDIKIYTKLVLPTIEFDN